MVQQDDATHQLVAADFWSLLLADPDTCQRHSIPVLEALRTDWRLAVFGQQVEQTARRLEERIARQSVVWRGVGPRSGERSYEVNPNLSL